MFNSNSKEYQDLFVLSVLDKKTNGTYVEIGGGLGTKENNTYLLETEYEWEEFSTTQMKNISIYFINF